MLAQSGSQTVELHDPDDDSYSVLHDAMDRRDFSRTVTINGVEQHLPTGLYRRVNVTETTQGILDLASAAADETGKSHEIVVAEYANGLLVSGLQRV